MVLVSGCQHEEFMPAEQDVDVKEVYATIEDIDDDQTRTYLSGTDVFWSSGDQIAVFMANALRKRFNVTPESIDSKDVHPERNLFLRGMVRSLGYRQEYVYYDRKERFAGESKYPLSKMLSFAVDGITSFSIKPLRLITSCGVVFMLISVGIIAYALYAFIAGHVVPGWTSLLVSLWFIGGAVLTAIGIIGEYIGKIYKEVKRRPRYFVEKTSNIE